MPTYSGGQLQRHAAAVKGHIGPQETLLSICVPERAPRIPIQLITLRGKRGYGLASALQVPDGTRAALSPTARAATERSIDSVTARSNRSGRATTPGRIRIRRGTCGRRAAPWTRRSGCPRPRSGPSPLRVRAPRPHRSPRLGRHRRTRSPRPGRCPDGLPVSLQPRADKLTGRLGPGCCEARRRYPRVTGGGCCRCRGRRVVGQPLSWVVLGRARGRTPAARRPPTPRARARSQHPPAAPPFTRVVPPAATPGDPRTGEPHPGIRHQ